MPKTHVLRFALLGVRRPTIPFREGNHWDSSTGALGAEPPFVGGSIRRCVAVQEMLSTASRLVISMGFGKDGKGAMLRDSSTVALGTLASNTSLIVGGLTMAEDFRILRSDIVALVANLTAGEGNGLLFGIANGELTAAEIAESLNIGGPLDRNDRVPQERVERNVKVLSSLTPAQADTIKTFLNDEGGPIIHSKHRWTYSNPDGWNFFVHNMGSGAFTTGAVVDIHATHFGVWVT